jgi:LuxR family maltose regulon positive regulatory protein
MSHLPAPILTTKLYAPRSRPDVVRRFRLTERLSEGLRGKLTLISAPAGFGKTTLVSEWLAGCERPIAWLSLDEGDNDPNRFLTYLVAALQTIAAPYGMDIGEKMLAALQSPQPPPTDVILTTLLNDITGIPEQCVLVLDDYHAIDSQPVDAVLGFLLEHLPPHMRLVIATREDPQLPLARLRAGGELTELRAGDLRFTPEEAAAFLTQVMGLNLSAGDIAALDARTEGWIAGLQLAAISLQRHPDAASFITSFTGSHRFVMDYLVEEVLRRQPESAQTFLLRTSILDRLCGPLCEAVALGSPDSPSGDSPSGDSPSGDSPSGQATLETLERANLFIVPLDNERRWYRYHHLFAELLRQRLRQSIASTAHDADSAVSELHIRASQWFEDHSLDVEAFEHAAAANDVERAERLMDGKGIPLHLRGAVTTILNWLASLPTTVLDARPSLWVRYGGLLLVSGQTTGVEEKLQAGENALQEMEGVEEDEKTRNLLGQIAAARATLALTRYQPDIMLAQSRRALEYLHPNNLALRGRAYWTMGYGYFIQGDRAAARQAYIQGIAIAQAARDTFATILSTIGLGNAQEVDNQLAEAAETYRRVLQLAGDQPLQVIYEAHVGLARMLYEWNDLDGALAHGQQSLHLAQQYESVIDRFVVCQVFLARLKLARGDIEGAAALLAEATQSARQRNFVLRLPEIEAAHVLVLLRQGSQAHLAAAAELAQTYALPISQARVHLAQGNPTASLTVLDAWRRQAEAKGWEDERLRAIALQAIALQAHDETDAAVGALREALTLAERGGCIRLFVDEGPPMARLLSTAAARGVAPDYIGKLLCAFEGEKPMREAAADQLPAVPSHGQPLIEPLSHRELEVLRLLSQGCSNQEISEQLVVALDTVKGHNRKIFAKLQVQRRTEAVARARELGLL